MDDNLAAVMKQVQRKSEAIDDCATDLDSWIGGDAAEGKPQPQPQPRKREKQSADDLKRELESEFLTPSPRFSTRWLNRLQR